MEPGGATGRGESRSWTERLFGGAYATVLGLVSPALRLRRRYSRDPTMRRERAGRLSPPPDYGRASPRLWVHGASVGEIGALPPILAELTAALPRAGIMVSALTDTGLDAARRLVGAEKSFALPLDLHSPLDRAFAALAPDALIIAETELWPGLLGEAHREGVPVVLVNARLSPSSARRYRMLAPLFRPLVSGLAGVAAQSPADAARFAAIGVPQEAIAVVGSSKFDAVPWSVAPEPPVPLTGRPVVVAGSTRPGDERIVLEALTILERAKPPLRPFLILAPRHLDRLPEVERLVRRSGRRSVRRTGLAMPLAATARAAAGDADVLILDTLGELAEAYALGWVAVVGGGFAGKGGHNLLEPAACGRAVLFGPRHRDSAGEIERLVAAGGGVQVAHGRGERGAESLARALAPFINHPDHAASAGERARTAVAGARGAARRAAAFAIKRLGLIP